MTHPVQVDLETPEADAAEQAAVVVPGWQDDDPDERAADEADRVVEFDDDYR